MSVQHVWSSQQRTCSLCFALGGLGAQSGSSITSASVLPELKHLQLLLGQIMPHICPHRTCKQSFETAGNLAKHLKQRHPAPRNRRLGDPSSLVGNSTAGEEPLQSHNVDRGPQLDDDDGDYTELNPSTEDFCAFEEAVINLEEELGSLEEAFDSSQGFDSSRKLLLWVARTGLSRSQLQDLLDIIHNEHFDAKKVGSFPFPSNTAMRVVLRRLNLNIGGDLDSLKHCLMRRSSSRQCVRSSCTKHSRPQNTLTGAGPPRSSPSQSLGSQCTSASPMSTLHSG